MGQAKFRVCAFAFNSPDELDAIKAELSGTDFVFTDLTPAAHEIPQSVPATELAVSAPRPEPVPQWFMDRCRPEVRCDIVIYSGEFAGGFFGKYGISLDLQEMEEASCHSRCQGLFHQPREVFLLGCNTLATKSADSRTPEQYLQVLLSHGFTRADAERAVDLRYGPLGPSFRESLRRSFMGVPRIYGFNSVAPRGEVTAPRLHEYFKRKGDYAQFLTNAGSDSSPNKELAGSFKGTEFVQTAGVTPTEPVARDRTLVCRLYDDNETRAERLRVVRQMLTRTDFLTFVPTVEVFLSRNPPEQLADHERQLFREIQALQAPRRQMAEMMGRLRVSAMKMQMAHLALQLGWMSPDEFRRLGAEGSKQLLSEALSYEVADIACDMAKYGPPGTTLRSEDFPDYMFLHWEGYRLIDCLSPTDVRLNRRMLTGLTDTDESIRYWAAIALSRRIPLAEDVLVELAQSVSDSSPRVRERVRWIFNAQTALTSNVLAAVRQRDPALATALETRPRRAL